MILMVIGQSLFTSLWLIFVSYGQKKVHICLSIYVFLSVDMYSGPSNFYGAMLIGVPGVVRNVIDFPSKERLDYYRVSLLEERGMGKKTKFVP